MEAAKKHAPEVYKFVKGLCIGLIVIGCLVGLISMSNSGDDGDLLTGLLVVGGATLAIWINFLIACEFYTLAVDKGYTRPTYLTLCFLLPVIGYLLVIAMPNKVVATSAKEDTLHTSLARINKLRESGVLTEEEAKAMRSELLKDI